MQPRGPGPWLGPETRRPGLGPETWAGAGGGTCKSTKLRTTNGVTISESADRTAHEQTLMIRSSGSASVFNLPAGKRLKKVSYSLRVLE